MTLGQHLQQFLFEHPHFEVAVRLDKIVLAMKLTLVDHLHDRGIARFVNCNDIHHDAGDIVTKELDLMARQLSEVDQVEERDSENG